MGSQSIIKHMNTTQDNVSFVRKLIKGKIAELIFQQMFRISGKFTLHHFGYEYTLPELINYEFHSEDNKQVLQNITTAPDFVVINNQDKKVHFVEVRYRSYRNPDKIKIMAENLLQKWDPSWLFIASPDGFFFSDCMDIIKNEGNIKSLDKELVGQENQASYLSLLNEFQNNKKL